MKKIISLTIALSLLLSLFTFTVSANETVSVLINKQLNFNVCDEEFIAYDDEIEAIVYPITYNDRTYIPARFIAEAIGLGVTWDGETQTVGFADDGSSAVIYSVTHGDRTPFYDTAILNKNLKFTMDGEPFVPREDDGSICYPLTYNDRTYIPARFIAEKAGMSVDWDGATQTVIIDYPNDEVIFTPTEPATPVETAPPAQTQSPAAEPQTGKLGLENYGFELWTWKPHASVVKFQNAYDGDRIGYIPGPIELIGKPLTFVEYTLESSFIDGVYSQATHFDFSTDKNILWVNDDYNKQSYLEIKLTGDVEEYKKALVQYAKDNSLVTDTIITDGKEYLPLFSMLVYEFDNDTMKIVLCDPNLFSYMMRIILQ